MILLQDLPVEEVEKSFQLFDKLTVKFFQRLAVDLVSVFVLIRFIYFPIYRSRENVFTFFIFNVIIFFITYFLNKVEMSLGAAFGLFAVFTMLRYRTEDINIKDMTYLFLCIAMGLINSVTRGSWDDLAMLSFIIIAITYLLESNLLIKKEVSRIVMYENIELIKPERRQELIADLEKRLGIKVNHITIGRVDFLRDAALIHVYYYET
jgi:hypothetical protein